MMFFIIVLSSILVGESLGQVLVTHPCPVVNKGSDASKYCSCSTDIIDCSGRNLDQVPEFSVDGSYHELRLDDNIIENITDNAFRNLQDLHRLLLQNNVISRVDDGAFNGLQKNLERLDMRSNSLTSFPTAIRILNAITWVDVSYNDIKANQFDEQTMHDIGDTLTKFEFGSSDVETWPTTLRHLQALEILNVTGGSFYTLPPDAFHGFEGTLMTLSIQNTSLIALPLALSRLRFLDQLFFDHNHDIKDSGVLIPSFGNTVILHNLHFLSLKDDGLTVFPSLLQYLRNVETLVLDSNRLAFVSDASVHVAVGTRITNLSMVNCDLSRVPGALSKLTNLTTLNLASNNIHSFENSDFDGMRKLTSLDITHNPLEYIANETFKDLVSLQKLNLKDTYINSIPEAIRFLNKLHSLEVPVNSIECTCNIVWLKQFTEHCNTGLEINGSCETIISSISDYLKKHIPNCPNYQQDSGCI